MASINFMFRPGVSIENQDKIIKKISGWTGVTRAARIQPNGKRDEIKRLYFVLLAPEADLEVIQALLTDFPELVTHGTNNGYVQPADASLHVSRRRS